VKCPERSGRAKRFVGKMTVGRHVNGENECRKINMDTIFKCPNLSAATLVQVGTQTAERDRYPWDMEGVPNKDTFLI
jgi:hypothetical protein